MGDNDPLSALRSIHLPEPSGWWPPATGWWLLLTAILIALAASFIAWRIWQKRAARRAALASLAGLRQLSAKEPLAAVAGLSALLRRCLLTVPAGSSGAGLVGEGWLAELDRLAGWSGGAGWQQAGSLLTTLPYRRSLDGIDQQEIDRLFALAERWIGTAMGRRDV
jgi:hypothetical protein